MVFLQPPCNTSGVIILRSDALILNGSDARTIGLPTACLGICWELALSYEN